MNKSERIMAARMNFVTRRGRSAEYQKEQWLKGLRQERNDLSDLVWWTIHYRNNFSFKVAGKLRIALIEAKKLEMQFPGEHVSVYDSATGILVYENFKEEQK